MTDVRPLPFRKKGSFRKAKAMIMTMRPYDVIKKKRDGLALTDAEIREFIAGYVAGQNKRG